MEWVHIIRALLPSLSCFLNLHRCVGHIGERKGIEFTRISWSEFGLWMNEMKRVRTIRERIWFDWSCSWVAWNEGDRFARESDHHSSFIIIIHYHHPLSIDKERKGYEYLRESRNNLLFHSCIHSSILSIITIIIIIIDHH